MNRLVILWMLLGMFCLKDVSGRETLPPGFEEALNLIQAYSGSGDQLQHAMQIADTLSKSHPRSGYAQTIVAEGLSTWELDQDGEPVELRNRIISLATEALKLNPDLASAYVARARALLRGSKYDEAQSDISAALKINASLSGALFLRADIFRRTGKLPEADSWYRQFIKSTSSQPRQSNGYYWIANMYQDAAWDNPKERKAFTEKARRAYEQMVTLDPEGVWKNVNFAIFLNDYAADFDAAEHYAKKALSLNDFPMARYHLAAAQYQKLWVRGSSMDRKTLATGIEQVFASTKISLRDALAFSAFSSVVRNRLLELQSRL